MSSDTVIRIRGARLFDPYQGLEAPDADIRVLGGRVLASHEGQEYAEEVVDARGLWVVPRLVDMHVHFREPGQTWKETILTGGQAAAHGGITAVAAMPNTSPVIDSPELVEWEAHRARAQGFVRLYPVGAITVGSEGRELADLYRMQMAGARAFSDDGLPLMSSHMMRAALSYSTTLRTPIINHAEDKSLSRGASVHEGKPAARLGLSGVPEAAESAMVWRDVLLAALTGGRLHVAHVSAPDSLDAVAWAHQRHLNVTAEATPHHLLLTDDALTAWGYNPVTKVNPPLRPEASRQALLAAVRKGLIGVMASDHAPHHQDDKARPYPDAPFGISGLETILGGLMTALIRPGLMNPMEALKLLTTGPDGVLGLGCRGLAAGEPADLTLIDPTRVWTVDPDRFYSMGHNTPLAGMELTGQAEASMVNGRWVMREGEVLTS